jgi:hypothetical protein
MNTLFPDMLVLRSALTTAFIHLMPFNFRHMISHSQDIIYEISMQCNARQTKPLYSTAIMK